MPQLFENEFIRQGILLGDEFARTVNCGAMSGWIMQVGEVLHEISECTGWKQAALAKRLVRRATVRHSCGSSDDPCQVVVKPQR